MSLLKLYNNPWGSPENDNTSKKPSSKESIDDNIEDILKQYQNFIKKFFGNFNKNDGKKPNNISNDQSSKSLIGIVILVIISLWLASGVFKVNPEENGLVLLLGKFHKIAEPGLNYHIPKPFGKVIKRSVARVNTEKFDTKSNAAFNARGNYFGRNIDIDDSDSLMLTGDENIVDIDFEVQWKISNIKEFVFNIKDSRLAIRKAAESAMREVIAKTPIASALSDGKRKIESEVKESLQKILDGYKAGVQINIVQLRRVDPPKQVIDAFRDVQTAKADKEKNINEAETYRKRIIPNARGIAEEKIQRAEGYKKEVIANAEGQVSRFNAVYNQYRKAKEVTRKRIYIETMEKVFANTNKIIIDKDVSKSGMVPFFSVNDLNKKK